MEKDKIAKYFAIAVIISMFGYTVIADYSITDVSTGLGQTYDSVTDTHNFGNVDTISIDVSGDANITGNVITSTVIDNTIFAQLSSSINQTPNSTNATVITYDTQDTIIGLNHSNITNPGEIGILTAGVYFISPQPQVGKTSGAAKIDFDMFLQVDRGAGFVNEPNSNIKLIIKDMDLTDVVVSAFTISLDVGDRVRLMQMVSSASVGMGLMQTQAEVGPPTVPATPSVIFTMYRIGG